MRFILFAIAPLIAAGILVTESASAETFDPSKVVNCSSWDYQTAHCNVGEYITDAYVENYQSTGRGRCADRPGVNWDIRGTQIRVWGGCRADFRVFADSTVVNCDSWDYQPNTCRIARNFQIDQVVLERGISTGRGRCTNQNWSYNRDAIHVSGGCRAQFRVYYSAWR